jgi:hypothetical protein
MNLTTYQFNRTYLVKLKDRVTFRRAFIAIAAEIGQWCRYIKYSLIAYVGKKKSSEDFVRKEPLKRRKQIEGILDWIEINSWHNRFDLFVFFMDPSDVDPLPSGGHKFDHHDDTCCWLLNLTATEFGMVQEALVAEGLPKDLFITKKQQTNG